MLLHLTQLNSHRIPWLFAFAQKFQAFTELMSNVNMKSLLSREYRWFDNQKNEGSTMYPFERASLFAQEVRKVQTSNDRNGLDECRIVISEIGNIIAFARTLRAAERRVVSNEMQYLASCTAPGATHETNGSGKGTAKSGVHDAVSAILQATDPDFTRAFVNVFKGVIQKSESDNLFMGSFYCIIPALCLNFMDTISQVKEILHKKNINRDGYYSDDGFAVGLAFSLSVLDQTQAYDRYVFVSFTCLEEVALNAVCS